MPHYSSKYSVRLRGASLLAGEKEGANIARKSYGHIRMLLLMS